MAFAGSEGRGGKGELSEFLPEGTTTQSLNLARELVPHWPLCASACGKQWCYFSLASCQSDGEGGWAFGPCLAPWEEGALSSAGEEEPGLTSLQRFFFLFFLFDFFEASEEEEKEEESTRTTLRGVLLTVDSSSEECLPKTAEMCSLISNRLACILWSAAD